MAGIFVSHGVRKWRTEPFKVAERGEVGNAGLVGLIGLSDDDPPVEGGLFRIISSALVVARRAFHDQTDQSIRRSIRKQGPIHTEGK